MLAESLMDGNFGRRPVILCGFSLGARVIYFCLKVMRFYFIFFCPLPNAILSLCLFYCPFLLLLLFHIDPPSFQPRPFNCRTTVPFPSSLHQFLALTCHLFLIFLFEASLHTQSCFNCQNYFLIRNCKGKARKVEGSSRTLFL